MCSIEYKKKKFIQDELWSKTIAGAFQRANVYDNEAIKKIKLSDLEEKKKEFKQHLRNHIEQLLPIYQQTQVLEEAHYKNIEKLREETKRFSEILKNGEINIGIAQKILNLYLKYQWCSDNLKGNIPPHCPVDRIIQKKAGFKENDIKSWTQIIEIEDYRKIIDQFSKIVKEENTKIATDNRLNLATWELKLYENEA